MFEKEEAFPKQTVVVELLQCVARRDERQILSMLHGTIRHDSWHYDYFR